MIDSTLFELIYEGFYLTFLLIAPALIVSFFVGFIFSIFQSVTQIQEQIIGFVPKLFAVALTLLITGSWMQERLTDFTHRALSALQNVAS